MTEESKIEQINNRVWLKPFWGYCAHSPGIVITISYILISVIGLIYQYVFFKEFGIDRLAYSGVEDFFLSALKNPIILVAFGVVVLLSIIAIILNNLLNVTIELFEELLVKKGIIGKKEKKEMSLKLFIYLIVRAWAPLVFAVWYAIAAVYWPSAALAKYNAGKIIKGNAPLANVKTNKNANIELLGKYVILDTSDKFIFLFDNCTGKSLVVSINDITCIN